MKFDKKRNVKMAIKHYTVLGSSIEYPLFHLSFNKDLEGVWKPREPDGYNTQPTKKLTDEEIKLSEPSYPRISTSPTLPQCFQAVYSNVKHYFEKEGYPYLEFFVYTPVFKGEERILLPKTLTMLDLTLDAHVTQEHVILDDVFMKLHSQV